MVIDQIKLTLTVGLTRARPKPLQMCICTDEAKRQKGQQINERQNMASVDDGKESAPNPLDLGRRGERSGEVQPVCGHQSEEALGSVAGHGVEVEGAETVEHTLADVKAMYGDKVIETATSFIVNYYGKYLPGITFVLPKDFTGDPLVYRGDEPIHQMVAELGIDFGAPEEGIKALFGDFWMSKRGKPHFRPDDVEKASHILLRVPWGGTGSARKTRGAFRDGKLEGTDYFRRAASNGGGIGNDYYVLPVGWRQIVRDPEIDGGVIANPDIPANAARIREMFAEFKSGQEEERRLASEARVIAEGESRAAREVLSDGFNELLARLSVLIENDPKTTYPVLEFGESRFALGYVFKDELYSEDSLINLERIIGGYEDGYAMRVQALIMKPEFEKLTARVEALGRRFFFTNLRVVRLLGGAYEPEFSYNEQGVGDFIAHLEALEDKEAEKRAQEATAIAAQEERDQIAANPALVDFGGSYRRMGANNQQDWFVIRADGTLRVDEQKWGRYKEQGTKQWGAVGKDELALHYERYSRRSIPGCTVASQPSEMTDRQLGSVAEIEEKLEVEENAFGLNEELNMLIDRRMATIKEAASELPVGLNVDCEGLLYKVLSSENGAGLLVSSTGALAMTQEVDTFEDLCEGREAQVVFWLSAADGVLEVVVYYKWGMWNANLRWRETEEAGPMDEHVQGSGNGSATDVTDGDEVVPEGAGEVTPGMVDALRAKFNG